jgi:hypothetical protein
VTFIGAVVDDAFDWKWGRSRTRQSCAAVLRLAMPDTGHPLVTASLLRTHQWIRDCPVCQNRWGLMWRRCFELGLAFRHGLVRRQIRLGALG